MEDGPIPIPIPTPTPTPTPPLINYPSRMSRPSINTNTNNNKITIERMLNKNHNPLSASRTILSDRFIPSRSSSHFSLFSLSSPSSSSKSSTSSSPTTPSTSSSFNNNNYYNNNNGSVSGKPGEIREDGSAAYIAMLRAALFGPESGSFYPGTPDSGSPVNTNIFRYKTQTRRPMPSLLPFGPDDSVPGVSYSPVKSPRKLPRSPHKVLDAPALQDDFYLNLVDWSSNNVLAVGLGNCVYLWNASSSKVTKLCDLGLDDSVCSVGWAQRGTHLAIGTNDGKVQIWDASRCKNIRTMEGHRMRVGALAWSSSVLSSGSRDKNILQRDIRAKDDFVSKLTGHKSEVCGLKWSYDNRELASGGNDNRLFVWNQHKTQPLLKYSEHTAAVKAIAWSPHLHGLLASGGGTADRCIRFWNTTTNSQLGCVDTGSQVCNLVWSKNVNELVSTHGYSQNQIIVWRYPSMSKLATLTGHTYRVLYLAISPDGQTIVTGAGDETLRFWNVFPSSKFQNSESEPRFRSHGRAQIR